MQIHSNLNVNAGSPVAQPAIRSTALVSISARMREINERACLANQKIEGIMRRAGLPIPPQGHASGTQGPDTIPSDDFQCIEDAISIAFSQVSELETLADALSYLA